MSSGINTEFRLPWAIQLMDMVSKDCNVKLSDRFKNDYMAATEYERGYQAQTIRAFDAGDCEVGIVRVADLDIVVAFRPSILTKEKLQEVLLKHWTGQWRTHDHVGFNAEGREAYLKFIRDTKTKPIHWEEYRKREFFTLTNAWFDIENGYMWTWEKCNPNDLLKNFKHSVKYMDAKRQAAANKPPQNG